MRIKTEAEEKFIVALNKIFVEYGVIINCSDSYDYNENLVETRYSFDGENINISIDDLVRFILYQDAEEFWKEK